MSPPDYQALRDEAYRAVTAIDERHFTTEALEGCIKSFARHIRTLTDALVLLDQVGHAAWHLLDDSGETDEIDDNGRPFHVYFDHDHQRLSDALDALEATGWDAHQDQEPTP